MTGVSRVVSLTANRAFGTDLLGALVTLNGYQLTLSPTAGSGFFIIAGAGSLAGALVASLTSSQAMMVTLAQNGFFFIDQPDVDIAAFTAHIAAQNNPHGTTKSQLGLGSVDNTADANKPVSTAQATAITAAQNAAVSTAAADATTKANAAKARSAHTGTQAISTITGLQAALDAAAASGGTPITAEMLTAALQGAAADPTRIGEEFLADALYGIGDPNGYGEAAATMANHTIRFVTTSAISIDGGTIVYSAGTADMVYVGGHRWEDPTNNASKDDSIYWQEGYWYCRLFSTLLGDNIILLRAAGTIDDDPSSLTYTHAPGLHRQRRCMDAHPHRGGLRGFHRERSPSVPRRPTLPRWVLAKLRVVSRGSNLPYFMELPQR